MIGPAQDDRFLIVGIKGEELLVLQSDLRTEENFPLKDDPRIGGRFKLEKATLAIDDANGKRAVVPIPAGDFVKVVANPSAVGNQMVDVFWEGRTVAMYVIDLKRRGIETQSP